ncbi:hypothetical protein Y032_0178g677 [Ancylostoma ceylanicum]|uniref:Uncharacterized protein n=1 Tax=Ancylostoma ceylanicum TaxID=53326 RepID=A0A016SU04_9BILA|nr:hypothetical protein Y032_0178g677 [Ancylostoma ceylanicum]
MESARGGAAATKLPAAAPPPPSPPATVSATRRHPTRAVNSGKNMAADVEGEKRIADDSLRDFTPSL